MNLPALLTQLEGALEALANSGFISLVNGHAIKDSGDRRILSFTSIPSREEYPRGRFSRVDEYIFALKWSEYSCVLFDGSIIQISYQDNSDGISFHRLNYHPCPIEIDLSGQDSFEQPLDERVLQTLGVGNPDSMKPHSALRFDYDSIPVEGHPLSHFTMLSSGCRIPVRAPVSLHRFFEFLFRNFYSDKEALWFDHIQGLKFDLPDCMGDEDYTRMHLAWR